MPWHVINARLGIIKGVSTSNAIIFDLGLSHFQLSDMSRGFSFKSRDKIDMNMGLASISAEKILNNCDLEKLKNIIKILGEEKEASKKILRDAQSRSGTIGGDIPE